MDTETGSLPQTSSGKAPESSQTENLVLAGPAGARPVRIPGRALSAEELAALVRGGAAPEKPQPPAAPVPIEVAKSPDQQTAEPAQTLVMRARTSLAFADSGPATPANPEPPPPSVAAPAKTASVGPTETEAAKTPDAEPPNRLAATSLAKAAETPAATAPMSTSPVAAASAAAVAGEGGKSAAAVEAPRSTARGHFDSVREGRAEGWAFDSANPDKKLKVEIWADGEFVAIGDADLFRDDLKKAGLADGKVHFSIALPAGLYDGEEHIITPKIASTGEAFGKPIAVTLQSSAVAATIASIAGSTMRGFVESHIGMWRTVDLYVDNGLIHSFDAVPNSREP